MMLLHRFQQYCLKMTAVASTAAVVVLLLLVAAKFFVPFPLVVAVNMVKLVAQAELAVTNVDELFARRQQCQP